MNNNIDLTKILKDCPKGTEFYHTGYGIVWFCCVDLDASNYPIRLSLSNEIFDNIGVTSKGTISKDYNGECLLFPSKEQRDWTKFTAPWYKKEDTIECLEEQSKEEYVLKSSKDEDVYKFMQYIEKQAKAYDLNLPNRSYDIYAFAKDLLVWLEKQGKKSADKNEPRFKVGNWITIKQSKFYQIKNITEKEYTLVGCDGSVIIRPIQDVDRLASAFTIQDAKDGDVLVNGSNIFIFNFINNRRLMGYCHVNMDDGNFYNDIERIECFCTIDAPVTPATKEQHDAMMKAMNDTGYEWNIKTKTLEEIIRPKFDPKTLKPFDRVLVRKGSCNYWTCDFFSHIIDGNDIDKYITFKSGYKCCIPYNHETKHLVGTTNEAPEYYRYWED